MKISQKKKKKKIIAHAHLYANIYDRTMTSTRTTQLHDWIKIIQINILNMCANYIVNKYPF